MEEKLLTLKQEISGDDIFPNIKKENIPLDYRNTLVDKDTLTNALKTKQDKITESTVNPFGLTEDGTGIDLHKLQFTTDGILKVSDAVTQIPTSSWIEGELDKKQDTLVSGTNIKTLNGQSILGSGDLPISGGESVSPTLRLIDFNTGIRTTITEQEKNNLEKGLYNQIDYVQGRDEIYLYKAMMPTKIFDYAGTYVFSSVDGLEQKGENNYICSSIHFYELKLGEKNESGEYPITINDALTVQLGGSSSSSYTPLELTMVKDGTEGQNFKITLTAEQKATFIKACQDNEPIIAIANLPILDGMTYKVPISLASLVNETYIGFASYSMVTQLYSGEWFFDGNDLKLMLISNNFYDQWGIYFDRDVEMTNRLAFADGNSFADFVNVQGEYVYFDKINGKSILHKENTINNYTIPTITFED